MHAVPHWTTIVLEGLESLFTREKAYEFRSLEGSRTRRWLAIVAIGVTRPCNEYEIGAKAKLECPGERV